MSLSGKCLVVTNRLLDSGFGLAGQALLLTAAL